MIDLRSDTVTQPTAEMLDAMRAAHLGDNSRDGDPTVRQARSARRRAHGQGSGDIRAQRHDGQSRGADGPYRPRRRSAAGREARTSSRARWARSPRSPACSTARSAANAARWISASWRSDQRAHEAQQAGDGPDRDGDDSQRRGRHRAAARSHGGGLRARPTARHSRAHRRRAAVQRGDRARRAGGAASPATPTA